MSGALARIEYWEQKIEAINAGNPQVDLGRAKELLAYVRWRAEREFPVQWGRHRPNINVIGKVEISEALDTVAGELLEQIVNS